MGTCLIFMLLMSPGTLAPTHRDQRHPRSVHQLCRAGSATYPAWWVLAARFHQRRLLSVFPGSKFALSLQTGDRCRYSERGKCLLIPHLCGPRCGKRGFGGVDSLSLTPPFHVCLTVALYSADKLAWLLKKNPQSH